MASHSNHQQHETAKPFNDYSCNSVDYAWFSTRFENLLERFADLQKAITLIEQKMQAAASTPEQTTTREYYSVPEFADLVGKNTTRTANGVVLNASMPRNVSLAVAMPKVGKFQSLN